jgi:manganese oxidase
LQGIYSTRYAKSTTSTLNRYLPHRLARPAAVTALSLGVAYGGGLWMQFMHQSEGAIETSEIPLVLQWLRNSTISLPLVILAVVAATVFARWLLGRYAEGSVPLIARATLATVVAVFASVAVVVVGPLNDYLFAAYRGGHELPLYLYFTRDVFLALVVNLPVSALITALLRGEPWGVPEEGGQPEPLKRRLAAQGLVAAAGLLVPLAALIVSSVEPSKPAVAQITPAASGGACPANVSDTKTFDVTAVDVDIPLNRFGDHDPNGKMYVLTGIDGRPTGNLQKVRDEEKAPLPGRVSIGLHGGDAIQPLVIRANEGDCVKINFTNNASGGDYGIHIDGLAFDASSSGDVVGNNTSSAVPRGQSRTYTYFVPVDPTMEGGHYMHPGPSNRNAVSHGLFGVLVVEPPGSRYLDPNTTSADGIHPDAAKPLDSGWEATIVPGGGGSLCDPAKRNCAFRENVIIYHEIGNEKEHVFDKNNNELPIRDPHTHSYRPGSRALNYRSEPFMDRLDLNPDQKSQTYGSYTFSDPATPMPRGYLSDPTKQRIVHAGSEVFHIHHLHGGGIRWRMNPVADNTYNYSDTGLNKQPKTAFSPSLRLDSQEIGPGESYNLEIEGGAGGVQQGAGEFLFHCHIAEHYFSGMWSFWRVFDTLQPDLAPLPDRAPLQPAVNSAELIGKTFNKNPDGTGGVTITKDNLKDWVEPQLPPQGVKARDPKTGFSQDASVMDWKLDTSTGKPIYVGEKEDKSDWPDLPRIPKLVAQGHPGSLIVDRFLPGANSDRPVILFNPTNGRPAFPLLRAHIGDRPPFAPNGHSGSPYLGEIGNKAPDPNAPGGVDPWANRPDGICPSSAANGVGGAQIRHNNIVGITLPIQNTAKGVTDPNGALFVLAQDKDDVYAHRKPSEPLALRANIGDCVFNTLTSELKDGGNEVPFSKVNVHIHHVQFDTQSSDGVISGFSYEQSVRPYKLEDVQLTADAPAGATSLRLSSVAKFQNGVYIGVGEGTNDIEIRKILKVNPDNTVTLDRPLQKKHPAGQWAGTEFVQYIWYPDVELDNIFFHDHVNGIFGWSHGMVGQFIVEPRGSTYHDPRTGKVVDSGTIVDIHTNNPLAPGVNGSFREMALWTIDNHLMVGSSLNLKAEPWNDRGGDPSLLFSSYAHGDPFTPLPRAYAGDPFVIRTINVGQGMQTLHIDGHRTSPEPRYTETDPNDFASSPINTIHYGISEKYTLILQGGAGGPQHIPGDYLYNDGVERSFKAGAWGILRVLPGRVTNNPADPNFLQPLPGTSPSNAAPLPQKTGGRPPAASGPGNPCPSGAPVHNFNVSAVDMPNATDGRKFAFVPSDQVSAVKAGKMPEPLVLHVAAGECVNVHFTNQSSSSRASFHLDGLLRDINSSGVDVGFNPEQTVTPGQSRDYRYFADTRKLESTIISDFGGKEGSRDGLYGAVIVAPAGSTFTDPVSGQRTDVGTQVDVHCSPACSVDGKDVSGYRDFALMFADQDPIIGQSAMPYPISVSGPALVNYKSVPQRPDDVKMFDSKVNGDPPTPILRAHAGDPVKVHMINAPGSEQLHTVSLGGLSWPIDPYIHLADALTTRALGPQEKLDAVIIGGAGGPTHTVGDFIYQDRRLAFTQAGMWGILRVLPPSDTSIKPLGSGGP